MFSTLSPIEQFNFSNSVQKNIFIKKMRQNNESTFILNGIIRFCIRVYLKNLMIRLVFKVYSLFMTTIFEIYKHVYLFESFQLSTSLFSCNPVQFILVCSRLKKQIIMLKSTKVKSTEYKRNEYYINFISLYICESHNIILFQTKIWHEKLFSLILLLLVKIPYANAICLLSMACM